MPLPTCARPAFNRILSNCVYNPKVCRSAGCTHFLNFRPFHSSINETSDTITEFTINLRDNEYVKDNEFIGLAISPARVEDKINDSRLQFVEEHPCNESSETKTPNIVMAFASGDGGSQQTSQFTANRQYKEKCIYTLEVSMDPMITGFERYVKREKLVAAASPLTEYFSPWYSETIFT